MHPLFSRAALHYIIELKRPCFAVILRGAPKTGQLHQFSNLEFVVELRAHGILISAWTDRDDVWIMQKWGSSGGR